ncbi:helix-turn-helix domain-containing protein [Streptomyces daliensis]|uniref:Helix-turn-helix domain-containing protein n=1 Tax=Streptomyces daliensis TaxID=299421 RepID=A0A8T4IRU8_9ACTN|nr:helix-turn-helix domain-containing protein [Streptomyces daliensis]
MSEGKERQKDHTADSADSTDWSLDTEDDSGPLLRAVGRMIKVWREAAGLTQPELGTRIGYGGDLVSSVERGRRIPKPEFLDNADRVLRAEGKISAMKKDVAEARYPKKVRNLKKLEDNTVDLGAYANHNVHGFLQTEEYARALFEMRRPAYSEDEIERQLAARLARQRILERHPTPMLTFVQEEVTLRRPLGGRMVLRRQLQRLLEVAQLRHVEIQVMPTSREEHSGMSGEHQVLKLNDGTTLGFSEGQLTSRLITKPAEVQILEMRYGMIRAQALTPRESLAYIEQLLGET